MQLLGLLCFFVTLVQINSERYLGNSEVLEGKDFFIQCTDLRSAGVTQGDLVQWTKDGKPLDNFDTGMVTISKIDAKTSHLIIQNATKEHEGEYRCLKNGSSSWSLSVKSKLRQFVKKTVYIGLNEPWHIVCNDLPSKKNVTWMKNGKPIEELSSGQIRVMRIPKGQSTLYSDSAAKEHEGTYTCTSEGSTIYSLEIKKAKYTGTKMVWKNDPWYIQCDDLQPEEKIYWTKDDHVIEELTLGEIKIDKGHYRGSKIEASHAKIEHSGKYKCTKGSKDDFSLKILDVNYNGPKDIVEGKPWMIFCNVKVGDQIAWSRNGEKIRQLETGEIEAINLRNGSSILQSRSSRVEHEGDYKCTQTSDNFFHLSIQKAKKIKVLKWNTSMDLECLHASKKDKIRWYKDGKLMNNTNKVLKLRASMEQVYGVYTCDAVNNTKVWSYFQVVVPPTTHIPQAGAVSVGEDFQTTCSVNFWPELQIKWVFANKTYTKSEGNVKLTRDEIQGVDNAVFTIENVQNIGKNQLKCMASFDWNEKNGYIGESTMDLLVTPY